MTQPDSAQMGTILSRMTSASDADEDFTLDTDQVSRVVEVLVPRIVEAMPGMPAHALSCKVSKDAAGWTIRVERPDQKDKS